MVDAELSEAHRGLGSPSGANTCRLTLRTGSSTVDPMGWIVDGMNVIGSRPDGWWRDRAGARQALVVALEAFGRDRREGVLVVFDGRPTPAEVEGEAGPGLTVRFAPGGPNAADDVIVALVGGLSPADAATTTVVTSDAALSERVRAGGASVMGARAFRRTLDGDRPQPVADR